MSPQSEHFLKRHVALSFNEDLDILKGNLVSTINALHKIYEEEINSMHHIYFAEVFNRSISNLFAEINCVEKELTDLCTMISRLSCLISRTTHSSFFFNEKYLMKSLESKILLNLMNIGDHHYSAYHLNLTTAEVKYDVDEYKSAEFNSGQFSLLARNYEQLNNSKKLLEDDISSLKNINRK